LQRRAKACLRRRRSHRHRAAAIPDGTPCQFITTMFGWCWASEHLDCTSKPFAVVLCRADYVGIYFSLGTDIPRKARPGTPTPLLNVRMTAPPSTTTSSLHCKAGSPAAQKLLSIFRLRGCCVSLALRLSYSRQVPRLALLASPEASPTRPPWQAICEEPSRRLQKQSGFTRPVLAHGASTVLQILQTQLQFQGLLNRTVQRRAWFANADPSRVPQL
jgi:hypothetical protein